jgi:hypothetical protein
VVAVRIAVVTVGCGGKSSPIEPKPGPTPTPVPMAPSVGFVSATLPCGSTVRASDFPMITFRVHYVTGTSSTVYLYLGAADGDIALLNNGATIGVFLQPLKLKT